MKTVELSPICLRFSSVFLQNKFRSFFFLLFFSRKQQKSLSYAKRLRITAPIFVEETRKQVKYGLLQHIL